MVEDVVEVANEGKEDFGEDKSAQEVDGVQNRLETDLRQGESFQDLRLHPHLHL